MSTSTPAAPGFLALLFFGVDIAARQAIGARLVELQESNRGIAQDHSLECLLESIETARTEGVAAMGGNTE